MRDAVYILLGTVTILGAFGLLLANPGPAFDGVLTIALAVLVGFVAALVVLVKIATAGGDADVAPAPWEESGALVERAPERSPADYDLSGERLAGVVEEAGATARDEGTVAAGIEVVRPHLRRALLEVLAQAGTEKVTAEHALARGTWTDDVIAAAALDESVGHPGWSFLERFEAWLFPEQVVRREVRRAMQAIARVADRELPTVPGQHAPRTVPVLQPTLEDLRRGADGHLQRAVDPLGARTGSDVDAATVVEGATTVGEADTAGEERGQERGDASAEMPDGRNGDEDGAERDSRPSASEPLRDVRIGNQRDERDGGEVTRR